MTAGGMGRTCATGFVVAVVAVAALLTIPVQAGAGAYVFAGETWGEGRITHPKGYTGAGGTLYISVGIDPASPNADDMEIPVQNMVTVFNNLQVTTGNLVSDWVNLPSGAIDFESVGLHELGHAVGLGHPNLGSQTGVTGDNTNFTASTDGVNDTFAFNAGVDGVIGSADDERDDDANLHWFKIADNDPFTIAGTVDQTTYSRDLTDLPPGDLFAVNADRTVAAGAGYPDNTEAVMQQGSLNK